MRAAFPALLIVWLTSIHTHGDEQPKENPASGRPVADIQKIADKARDSIVQVTFSGRDGKQQGLGTGFVISPDGLIATNLHVIGEARPISVEMADGRKFEVKRIHAFDRHLDLAVIEIDAKELPALKLGDPEKVKDGQTIAVVGNPLGLKHSVASGVISGRRNQEGRSMLQLDMLIERGNSGSPVLDADGRVLGIVTLKSLVTKNLGFAVDVIHLKQLLAKPNSVPMSRWLTIGELDRKRWQPLLGAKWKQRAGRISVEGAGADVFGRRALCVSQQELPDLPFELGVWVKLSDESGAAGLIFNSDGADKHYGFYPSRTRLRLSRFEGPTVDSWQVLEEIETPHYRPGEWNYLKIRFEKDLFQCFVNDALIAESRDKILPPGKVGLAKFRDITAEFKQFRVARKLPSTALSDETKTSVNKLIDKLPALAALQDKGLAELATTTDASTRLLREHAAELRKRAEELQQMATDLQVRSVAADLTKLLAKKDAEVDLLSAALLIAKLDDEELDLLVYREQVDRMVNEIKKSIPADADETAKLTALRKYLFDENGFHGSRTNYYHRANSYINNAIDDREGLPITLSVLFMEMGRRLGIRIEGVGLPGHFVVKHIHKKGEQLVDVFDGGRLMTRDDANAITQSFAGRDLRDDDLNAAAKKAIVLRMLQNLFGVADREAGQKNSEPLLRYLDAMLAIDPHVMVVFRRNAMSARGLRAMLRFETGRRSGAIADLDWFLENQPEGVDLDRIRQMREMFLKRPR
ncbi:MAG: trypsin-like peptidase domain-containing protein [Planctomycetes bacterium]|nr:trypsin-like peptidase domain-containing protein [Planctomycetota bacterium]